MIYKKTRFRSFFGALIILLCLAISPKMNAQMVGTPYPLPQGCTSISTQGTDFWVSFGCNYTNNTVTNVYLALKISNVSNVAATVTLSFTAAGTSAIYTVSGNSQLTIDLSQVTSLGDMRTYIYNSTVTTTNTKTLHITATQPVSVIAFNTGSATTDATILLPSSSWGTNHYRLSYVPFSTCYDVEMLIAYQNNTNIYLNGGSTPMVTLNAGQLYYYLVINTDLTGRHITSDKPVAYFVHSTLVDVPSDLPYGDILFEQLPPVPQWGKNFLVPNAPEGTILVGSPNYNNLVRVMASKDGTIVNFSGTATHAPGYTPLPVGYVAAGTGSVTLNAGQWTELQINDGSTSGYCTIIASQPVGVAAYMVGSSKFSNGLGDPSVAWIPPLEQAVPGVVIAPFIPPGTGSTGTSFSNSRLGNTGALHYAIIITPTASKNSTTIAINGNTPTAITSGWTDDATTGYSYYRYNFSLSSDMNNTFRIDNPSGVLVLCGGVGAVETYYYSAGNGGCFIGY